MKRKKQTMPKEIFVVPCKFSDDSDEWLSLAETAEEAMERAKDDGTGQLTAIYTFSHFVEIKQPPVVVSEAGAAD